MYHVDDPRGFVGIVIYMKIYKNNTADVVILERGEELFTSLEKYATKRQAVGAWLQSGLGGAGDSTLSFYDIETKEYVDKVFTGPLEILSLQGNLSWDDGKPFWHVHGVFGNTTYGSIGGHVKCLRIALTGELLIVPLATEMARTYDETTGLKLLN